MTPEQIGQAYNQITDRWTSTEFDQGNGIKQLQRAVRYTENRGSALDVGCGCTGRFIDLLLKGGFSPEGLDISDEMVRLARIRHPEVPIHQGDICQWRTDARYDLIAAWDSIWHIPLEQQSSVLTKLVSWLRPEGVLIFSFGGTDEADEHTDDSMGPGLYYSTLGANGFLELLLKLGCRIRHFDFDQLPELHAYAIVQRP